MGNALQIKILTCVSASEGDADGDQMSIDLMIDSSASNKQYSFAGLSADSMHNGDEVYIGNIFECNNAATVELKERDASYSPLYTSFGTKVIDCTKLGTGVTNFNLNEGNYNLSWEILLKNFQVKSLELKYIQCLDQVAPNNDQVLLYIIPNGNIDNKVEYFNNLMHVGDQWYIGYKINTCSEGVAFQMYEKENDNGVIKYAPLGAAVLQCDVIGEYSITSSMVGGEYKLYWGVTYNTNAPTKSPTSNPTLNPTELPTSLPTFLTLDPTRKPTTDPSTNPTMNPTTPTIDPTLNPTPLRINAESDTSLDSWVIPTVATLSSVIGIVVIGALGYCIYKCSYAHGKDPQMTIEGM